MVTPDVVLGIDWGSRSVLLRMDREPMANDL